MSIREAHTTVDPQATLKSQETAARPTERKLPLPSLLALAMAVFITSLTETLPAGLLPAMSADLRVSESATGQTVTIYAIGTALTAIPLTAATAGWRRKRLLLASVAGFAVANTVTALSAYLLRHDGGAFRRRRRRGSGLGAARRVRPPTGPGAPPGQGDRDCHGRYSGRPVLGVPAGTFLGKALSWQTAFLVMTVLTVGLLAWIGVAVPDHPGRRGGDRTPMLSALRVPGVAPVLFVTLVFVLAHTILYTFIATFLDALGMGGSTDLVLLVFGAASLLSIWVVAAHSHRRLRTLTLASSC